MNEAVLAIPTTAQRSSLYANYAALFRYPNADGVVHPDQPDGPEYLRAFETSVYEDACSLHETCHSGTEQAALYEDLIRFYSYFGLRRLEDSEFPDHLSLELEFMHFLTYLEEQAVRRGEATRDLRKAQQDFLKKHVSLVSRSLLKKYQGDNEYYRALIRDFHEYIETEIQELKE